MLPVQSSRVEWSFGPMCPGTECHSHLGRTPTEAVLQGNTQSPLQHQIETHI